MDERVIKTDRPNDYRSPPRGDAPGATDVATSPVHENVPSPEHARADPYASVVAFLFAAASVGMVAAIVAGRIIGNKVVLEAAVSLGLAAGCLLAVLLRRVERARPVQPLTPMATPIATDAATPSTTDAATQTPSESGERELQRQELDKDAVPIQWPDPPRANMLPALSDVGARVATWAKANGAPRLIELGVAAQALIAIAVLLFRTQFIGRFTPVIASVVGGGCVLASALCAVAARYLSDADAKAFPEATGLARGARVMTWVLLAAASAVAAEWFVQVVPLGVLHVAVLVVNVAVAVSILAMRHSAVSGSPGVDLPTLRVLGGRWNIVAGLMDAAERQLGIDLRSTWALTVVRRGLEPLAICLAVLAWLSTSLTVIGVEEQGLIERLGVPVRGPPASSGLRLHWPWPIDRVYRMPVRRVQSLGIGHEGEEAPGPENVLWSVQHAENEFTLLLGNGRDLITVDAAVQFRIVDPTAWRYHSQNPAAAIRALAYRAVMRNTVNRTLSDALSENVAALTSRMRSMVQQEADALGLGVQIVGFTVGGMHPPVMVAAAYEGVVSAQISKATAVVNAQVFRNETLPAAESSVLVAANAARADGFENLARAAGDAWAFRVLEAQYRASPAEYFFRRRLETLEQGLAGKPFTILDARFVRDGGEIWMTP